MHLDVDVLRFVDTPLADVPEPHGLSLGEVAHVLRVLATSPRFAGLSITEINPAHMPDDGVLPRFVDAVVTALTTGRGLAAAHLIMRRGTMITCVVEYTIDATKIDDFERFARAWIRLVDRHGGTHHGYFLPSEGASDRALALFSFASLAAYEVYREGFGSDPELVAADKIRDDSGCVLRYERSFMRPLLDGAEPTDETSAG